MKRLLLAFWASLACVTLLNTAYGRQAYTITDLGPVMGAASPGFRINNASQVIGLGLLRQNDTWTSPGTLPQGQWSKARAINDYGIVVGNADTGQIDPVSGETVYHAFLRQHNGTMVDLGSLVSWSSAQGINEFGLIVGVAATDNGGTSAVLWDNEGLHTLDALGGNGWALAIDAQGRIVGGARNPEGHIHAILWSDHTTTDLGRGSAYAINLAGDIVGFLQNPNGDVHAALWRGGAVVDLGNGMANDINSMGQIAGWSWVDDGVRGAQHAFLWHNNAILDLNSLLQPDSAWVLQEAQAINDRGQIVGYGAYNGQLHGFLLEPVPEPSSLLALAGSLAALGGFVLRRRR